MCYLRICFVPLTLWWVVNGCSQSLRSASVPQSREVLTRTEFVRTETVYPGVIRGVAIDGTTGRALSGAQVHVDGLGLCATTNDLGRFGLRDVPIGKQELVVELLGYATQSVTLMVDSLDGHAGVFALTRQPIDVCVLYDHPPAVSVTVKSVLSGRAPEGEVKLVLTDGEYRDSAQAQVASPGEEAVILGAGHSRYGTYDVELTSPGYEKWHAEGVEVGPVGTCRNFGMRILRVWLLPDH